ncbi:bacterial transcriptional activator domain-containing protein [Streptomyces diastatochromogenes]|nr:bacterial transcriptional activator domain-containing protein [Streptomyces diastatochromogenes]
MREARGNADRDGSAEAVYERLTRAVGRWRGVPLAGVPGPWAERRREQLTESLAAAREELCAAALALGRYGRWWPNCARWSASSPFGSARTGC